MRSCVFFIPALFVLLGQGTTQPQMKPVDPGVADMGPLSGPGRALSPGLRQPQGFDRVYEVEMDGKKYFARANGSTVAVFPRSSYVLMRGTVMPVVPAGTRFYLGGLPDGARPIPLSEMPANYAGRALNLAAPARAQDTRVDLSAAGAMKASGLSGVRPVNIDLPASDGNVWDSEGYRIRRTAQLIDAARAARARQAG